MLTCCGLDGVAYSLPMGRGLWPVSALSSSTGKAQTTSAITPVFAGRFGPVFLGQLCQLCPAQATDRRALVFRSQLQPSSPQ